MGEQPDYGAAFWESDESQVLVNPRLGEVDGGWRDCLEGEGERGQVVFATSGSEGGCKLVAISRAALLGSAKVANEHLGLAGGEVWCRALPAFHVGGLAIHARAYVGGGRVVELGGKWDALRFVRCCEDSGASLSALVPTQVYDLVAAGQASPPGLGAVLVGGGALDWGLAERARALGWELIETYGMTEAGSQVATQRGGGGGGWYEILRHWEVRMGEGGRLQLRGEGLFTGYLEGGVGGEWRLERARSGDGWYESGDRCELDGRRLRVLGRAGRVVKVLGELVDLDRLGRVAAGVAGELGLCGQVAVAGIRDRRAGHLVALAWEGAEGGDAGVLGELLLARYGERVLPYERAAWAVRLGQLPRTGVGKIDWPALVEAMENEIAEQRGCDTI
jgi:o-succinylbenzoate---CoA ligase